LTDPEPPESGQTFRIGTVSRLTGVPTDTLRVWERRYHVVTPVRSEAGTRHYAAEDVGRLSLNKRLVDGGDAISRVANLSLKELRERMRSAESPERLSATERPCRALVCGPVLAERLRAFASRQPGIRFLGFFGSPDALQTPEDDVPDVLVLELPTLHAESVREINQLLRRSCAERLLLVYGFASRSALNLLDPARVMTLRSPVDLDALCEACIALVPEVRVPREASDAAVVERLGGPVARRFKDVDLARLSAAPCAGECNWPHHLVDLISALAAFETYSLECAGKGAEDPALIAFVNACSSRARALMEAALARVAAPESKRSEAESDSGGA